MKIAVNKILRISAFLALTGSMAAAQADAIPYPTSGAYNSTTYSFTAAADGDVVAYIVGGFGAGFTNEMGLLVNGVLSSAGYGLNNHSSALGDSFNLGSVLAGDVLTFVLHNLSLGMDAFSDPTMNAAYDEVGVTDHNHIYSTAYTATGPVFSTVPVGTYVAFEDLPFPSADFNYDDESFVFTNVATRIANVPEPGSLALVGLALAGVALRRRKQH